MVVGLRGVHECVWQGFGVYCGEVGGEAREVCEGELVGGG